MKIHYLKTPLTDEDISKLEAGDIVYLSGKLYTARDMAHYKLKKLHDSNKKFDEDLKGQAIFHAGPIISVNKKSQKYKVISIGPTSSIRMDSYTDMVGSMGVKVLIGKGGMSDFTTKAMKKHTMAYLLAAHGCAAVHTQKITDVTHQYWMDEIGMPEAMWVLECNNLGPLIVGIDCKGRNLFEETRKNSKKRIEAIIRQAHSKIQKAGYE